MRGRKDKRGSQPIDEKTLDYKKKQEDKAKKEEQMRDQGSIAQRMVLRVKKQKQYNDKKTSEVPKMVTETKRKTRSSSSKSKDNKKKEESHQPPKNLKQKEQPEKKAGQNESLDQKESINFTTGTNESLGLMKKDVGLFPKIPVPPSKPFLFGAQVAETPFLKETNNLSNQTPFATLFNNFVQNSSKGMTLQPKTEEKPIDKPVEALGQQQEEDSAQLEKEQKIEIDPSKSKGKYKYDNMDSNFIFCEMAIKFKKNDSQPIQNVQIIVQSKQKLPNMTISWVTIRLKETQNAILTGFIVKNKTQIKNFGHKDQNVVLSLIVRKGDTSESAIVKVQFETPQIGRKFITEVNKLLQK